MYRIVFLFLANGDFTAHDCCQQCIAWWAGQACNCQGEKRWVYCSSSGASVICSRMLSDAAGVVVAMAYSGHWLLLLFSFSFFFFFWFSFPRPCWKFVNSYINGHLLVVDFCVMVARYLRKYLRLIKNNNNKNHINKLHNVDSNQLETLAYFSWSAVFAWLWRLCEWMLLFLLFFLHYHSRPEQRVDLVE